MSRPARERTGEVPRAGRGLGGEIVIEVVTVCTHNRTRSVIAAALLTEHLDRLGVDNDVRSAGIVEGGHPPTPRDLESWIDGIERIRPARSAYLQSGGLPMIEDPTGGSTQRWASTFAEIDDWCERVANLLV